MVQRQKHFDYLHEMGIPLWQRRNLEPAKKEEKASTEPLKTEAVNLTDLKKEPMFIDILLSINVEEEQVMHINDATIDLGKFHWQFSKTTSISFKQNLLETPNLTALKNPKNKRFLYQILASNHLM